MEVSKSSRSSLYQKSLDKHLPQNKGWCYQFCWQKNAEIFKKHFCTLADALLANLPSPSLRFGLYSVWKYYKKVLKYLKSKCTFNFVSEETVWKLLQDLDENKSSGLDNLSDKFLKDGATVLAKPISQICNLSIKYSTFLPDCKIAKIKPLFKKVQKQTPRIIVLYPYFLWFLK